MSNALYQKGRQKFLDGQISWSNDNIKAALLNPNYVPDLTGHEFFSSISSYVLTGTTPIKTLTGKSSFITNPNTSIITYGVANAAPTIFQAITAIQTIGFIVIFKDSGVNVDGAPQGGNASTSPLINIYDSGYGIGAGTNGGDIEITWDLINGLFKL